jgi:hypothetical protein
MFAAVTHLDEGLGLEAFLTLKAEKSLNCLLGTERPTVSIIEQNFVLENVGTKYSIKKLTPGIKRFEM